MRRLLIPLLAFLLAACNLPVSTPDTPPASVTDTPYVGASDTQCAWVWATQSLPDLSIDLQSALEKAGLKEVTASAEAFGENCITGTGQVDHFATMETDFRFTVQVASLEDHETLGALLEQILVVVDGFPPGTASGPNKGYIGVTFQAGDKELRLWFQITSGESARELGLHGAALLDTLQNK